MRITARLSDVSNKIEFHEFCDTFGVSQHAILEHIRGNRGEDRFDWIKCGAALYIIYNEKAGKYLEYCKQHKGKRNVTS